MHMNPSQQPAPTPPPPSPDYLNQIAPQAPKKQLFQPSLKLLIIAGVALVLAVIVVSVVLNIVSSGQRQPIQRLAARLETTKSVADDAQAQLKSSRLRSLNSSLSLFLADTNSDIAEPFSSAGVDVKKISDSIKQEESGEAMTGRLEDARLNAVYDRTYSREMAYQLDTIITLMQQIYATTSNQELKTFLQTTFNNLEPTQQAFEDFDETDN